jgi:hypothetical protein
MTNHPAWWRAARDLLSKWRRAEKRDAAALNEFQAELNAILDTAKEQATSASAHTTVRTAGSGWLDCDLRIELPQLKNPEGTRQP